MNNTELHNLIERLQSGDPLAFDELYRKCSGYVAFVCNQFCSSKEDAEEVVNDVFMIIHKKSAELRADTFMAYLRKIAIHECYRKRDVNREHIVFSGDINITQDQEEYDEDYLPEQYLQNKERRRYLLTLMKTLPKMQWETLYLRYYGGLGTEEIANLQKCSTSNVRKTLRAAHNAMKKKLTARDSMAVVPLAAVLLAEEAAFATGYVAITGAATATTMAGTAAKSATGYIIAVCIAVSCIATATLYFALRTSYEEYAPVVVATETPPLATPATEPQPEYTTAYYTAPAITYPAPDATETDLEYEIHEEYSNGEPEAEEEPAPPPTRPTTPPPTIPEHITEPPTTTIPPTTMPPTEPVIEPTTAPPLMIITAPPTEPYIADRTPQILYALSQSTTAEDTAQILDYYNFVFHRQIRSSTYEIMRFYVANEGSGSILVGIAVYEDGTNWRMSFRLFENGQVPTDVLELMAFMTIDFLHN